MYQVHMRTEREREREKERERQRERSSNVRRYAAPTSHMASVAQEPYEVSTPAHSPR